MFGMPLERILEIFIEYGFNAIDIPGDQDQYPINILKNIIPSYTDKIEVAEITSMMNPERDLIHPNQKVRRSAINYIKYCIDVAAELDVNLTHMCFLTFEENLHKYKNQIEGRQHTYAIECIKECAKYAENLGVKLLMEPLYNGDISIVNTSEQAVNLFSEALNMDKNVFMEGNHNYGLLQDIFHMHHEENNLIKTIERFQPITYHMHVADHIRSLDFTQEDSKFVKEAIKKLEGLDYLGSISFESFHKDVTIKTLRKSLNQLKSFRQKCHHP